MKNLIHKLWIRMFFVALKNVSSHLDTTVILEEYPEGHEKQGMVKGIQITVGEYEEAN